MSRACSRYYTYQEMVDSLRESEKRFSDLLEVTSIGESYEKRELLMCIVTQKNTGSHLRKPAVYVDGNHHAAELTGSAACLYTVEYLLDSYGQDPEIESLLDAKTFYILPRVSPDGAELCLTTPYMLRSTPRPYPDHDLGEGLVPGDVDGDGNVLQMRWRDDAGQWKISEKDTRAMVARKPGETAGAYYRMATEGFLNYFDGVEIKPARSRWEIDLNRNYPGNWHGPDLQTGPGPFPFSEPETRAIGDFFRTHTNIAAACSYHTASGLILRPRTAGPDRDIPLLDLFALTAIGRRGMEITGYPCVSAFEDFTTDQRHPSSGTFLDFAYDLFGTVAFMPELWDLRRRAGIPARDRKRHMYISEDEMEADQLKYLSFVDRELGGVGFHPWKAFEHPQLGKVELGGLDPKLVRQNPPVQLLEQECRKAALFSIMLGQTLPELHLENPRCAETGPGQYEFTCSLKNKGYLSTSATQQAQIVKAVRPLKVKVRTAQGVTLVYGKPYDEIPHLQGWGACSKFGSFGLEKKLCFVFRANSPPAAGKLCDLTIESERAGSIETQVVLGR